MQQSIYGNAHDAGERRLTQAEAEALIRLYHERQEAGMRTEAKPSVGDLSELLGITTHQVESMLGEVRAREAAKHLPPAAPRDKRRTWLLFPAVLACILGFYVVAVQVTAIWFLATNGNRERASGFYRGDGMPISDTTIAVPDGFSFKVQFAGRIRSAYGGQSARIPVERMSPERVEWTQKQYASSIMRAMERQVRYSDPWQDGVSFATVALNCYLGGPPVPVEIAVPQGAFPLEEGKKETEQLRQRLMDAIKKNWTQVTKTVEPVEAMGPLATP